MQSAVRRASALFIVTAMTTMGAELDIRKVALYKHGIGYFERAGRIAAGESAQLSFKADEMNDVLKSLTIEQRGGEGVSSVRYDSSDPLAKRLEVFPFRIGQAVTMAQILDQFKGADVELRFSSGPIQGKIISSRTLPANEQLAERNELLLLVDSGEILKTDPYAASGVRFPDEKIQQQFQEYLAVLSQSRNLERRTVTIQSGEGASDIAASYVAPTPIWKTSYRLIFGEGQNALLEGWAIVDNTSGQDWSNVVLSLVSGLPVSFISKLYEPRYVERPVIQLAQDRAWRPIVHGGAVELAESAAAPEAEVAKMLRGNAPPAPMAMADRSFRQTVMAGSKDEGFIGGAGGGRFEARQSMASNVAATAVGAELGELFEYRIERPVTIKKGESAMLPFVRQPIDARRLLIYDEANGSQHPLNAVELTNSSKTTLDGGAITVYEQGGYAGEALVETVKTGDKRLISYAVDLGSRITTAYDSSSKLQSKFTYHRGILTTRTAQRDVKTFTIHNVDSKAKTVIIEHPVRPEYKLINMQPAEKTASAYRFEVQVAPGATEKYPVTEEHVYSQAILVSNLDYNTLMSYVRNDELDAAGRQKLSQIAELTRQIAENERSQQDLEKQIQDIFNDQNRLRSNISTLRSVSGQDQKVQEYANTLAAQEAQLVTLRDRQAEVARQRERLQRELDTLIETLEI